MQVKSTSSIPNHALEQTTTGEFIFFNQNISEGITSEKRQTEIERFFTYVFLFVKQKSCLYVSNGCPPLYTSL